MSERTGTQSHGRHELTLQQAVEEAHRCMLCHDAPCSTACPGGTDPAKFVRQIRFYNLKGAARTVLENNPLGGVCGHVCPTEDTCVRACLRTGLDRPIDIDGLQCFAVSYGRKHGVRAMQPGEERKERVAVVGAGPAGLSAAAHLAQLGYPVTLFEARAKAGGMLRYGVPLARLSEEVLDEDLEEIISLGVELKTNQSIETENGGAKLLEEGYEAVFIAPGLWKPVQIDIPGGNAEGVSTALKFLEQTRTERDKAAALVEGKNVAVIGGGSVAMDVTSCARELGAKKIYAIALESMTELPAQAGELQDAIADGVIFKPQCRVTKIVAENGQVAAVEGVETEWIKKGNLSPSNARDTEGTSFRIRAGALIQAIGQAPAETALRILTNVKKNGNLLAADEQSQKTSLERVFAGGDIVRGAGTVVDAVGDGRRAARAIHGLLSQEVAK